MTETYQIDQPDSVIITLEPDPDSRTALAVQDGVPDAVPAKEYHMTLIRVGDISATAQLSDILQVLLDFAADHATLLGEVSGAGFFGKDGFNGNTVLLVDIDGIAEFRAELMDALASAKVKVDEEYDFIPHITVAKGPVISPESNVGTALSFGNFGLRFGTQAAMVPFALEPEPVAVPPAAPAAPQAPTAPQGAPVAPAAPARPAAPAAPAAPQKPAPAAASVRQTAEFGEAIQDEESGQFRGSEPGPMSDEDRAEGGLGAAPSVDEATADAMSGVIDTGMWPGGDGNPTDDAEQATSDLMAQMEPAASDVQLTCPISLDNNPFTASEMSQIAMTAGGVGDQHSAGMPTLSFADTNVAVVGGGSPLDVVASTFDTNPNVSGQTFSASQGIFLQVNVPEGHPVANLGSVDDPVQEDGGSTLSAYESQSGLLHPDTVYEVTGGGLDPHTGAVIIQANASMPEGQ